MSTRHFDSVGKPDCFCQQKSSCPDTIASIALPNAVLMRLVNVIDLLLTSSVIRQTSGTGSPPSARYAMQATGWSVSRLTDNL